MKKQKNSLYFSCFVDIISKKEPPKAALCGNNAILVLKF
jgi:hypothetical protein